MHKHTTAELQAIVEKIIEENHGMAMQLSQYENDGLPTCIIGHVLFRCGFTAEQLRALDNQDSETTFDALHKSGVLKEYGFDLTNKALHYMNKLQTTADAGLNWIFAEQNARAFINKLTIEDM